MTPEDFDREKIALERLKFDLERQKWATESRLREREVDIKFAEQRAREADLELKRQEQSRAGWSNPLVVAILAAAIAAAGNAIVSVVNGVQEREIEDRKSEQARILEMIKTGNTEKAAANLEFLLTSGLIDNAERAQKIRSFLAKRAAGSGPVLPSVSATDGISPRLVDAYLKCPLIADRDRRLECFNKFGEELLWILNYPKPNSNEGRGLAPPN